MQNDVSRTTVTVLLILTVLVSIIGTWAVLSSMTAPKVAAPSVQDHPVASGVISLRVISPEEMAEKEPKATGLISLKIKGGGE